MRTNDSPRHVAVVIPAHDEADLLPACVDAVLAAADHLGAPALVVVVLDACHDGSSALRGRFGDAVDVVSVDVRNVGAARAAGFAHARAVLGAAGVPESAVWYATTDADSTVDRDWLVRQVRSGADMVLGVVRVTDWHRTPAAVIRNYLAAYRAKVRPDGHGHVHGANMGFRADKYWLAGGFDSLTSDEDVGLVEKFERHGFRIDRDRQISVATSARPVGRAPRGFAAHLRSRNRVDGQGVR